MANHSWLFGLPMCDIFHAMDILASTASIWNLCVISLDRCLANLLMIAEKTTIMRPDNHCYEAQSTIIPIIIGLRGIFEGETSPLEVTARQHCYR
uniref:G_PROTEIN_RECEP_F1_2 domain-containing protein n=1 Tax=Caenorhabditis tropicalis TaxID=1561998 RepID=A0A1I7T5J5_9PELO